MADAIRVLISDEEPDSRVAVRRSLQRANIEVAGETGFGTAAISLAAETRPDVVLVAVEEPITRALDTAEGIANVLPATPIIVYSSLADAQAIRRAMVFGARDYLVKPIQADTLRDSIFRALSQEERRQMRHAGQLSDLTERGTVVAVVGAKGGIGKSVISANLGLAIRRQTRARVCIFDADAHFGDIATLFNEPPTVDVGRFLQELPHVGRDKVAQFMITSSEGVDLLAASQDDGWEDCTREDFDRVVELLAQVYDYVVIDTSGSFDRFTRMAMEQATLSLMVTSGEVSSIRGTAAALRRVAAWEVESDRVRIVLNHTERRSHIGARDIEQGIGTPIFYTVPFDADVIESVQLGQPALLRSNSRFGYSIDGLAGLITGRGRVQASPAPADTTNKLRRLLSLRGRTDDARVAPVSKLPDQQ